MRSGRGPDSWPQVHRERCLIETIAETIRPEPVLSAARGFAAALTLALPLTLTPAVAMPHAPMMPAIAAPTWPTLAPAGGPLVQPPSLPIAARREGNGKWRPRLSVQVHLTYNISGKASDTPDFRQLLDQHADHVAAPVQEKLERTERTAY